MRKIDRKIVWGGGALALLAVVSIGLAACSTLPRSERSTTSIWPTFAAAKAAYEKVKPGVTTVTGLHQMGYDPYSGVNIQILSYLDVTRSFTGHEPAARAGLPVAVKSCIQAQNACMGYEVSLERIRKERKGSAIADMLKFRRHTYETGWKFKALFVIHDGLVVYKLWSGIPRIDRHKGADNPLGPLQEPADIPADILERQIP